MKSIRAKLTLWHVGVLVLIVVLFSAGVFVFARASLYAQLDRRPEGDLAAVRKVYRDEPNEIRELESYGAVPLYEVVEGDRVVHRTAGWPQVNPETHRILVAQEGSGRVLVAREVQEVRGAVQSLGMILLLGIPGAVVLALLGGYFLAGRVLRAVGAMADKAREITAERLGDRLPVENSDDEFGRLAGVFNETLARLQNSFEQLRRFTADASHELRTPLTALRSVGEVALASPHDASAYRDVIGSMLEEVDRLSKLVESLLVLTRADSGTVKLTLESVDVAALARSTVDCVRVLAEEKEQRLSVDGAARVEVQADPAILRQALLNLLDNAIKYTPEKGEIRVDLRATDHQAVVEVRDTGPGIPPEHRERIFDRFYRVDGARSKETGGVGLGLAIAKWAVEVNGGRRTARGRIASEPGKPVSHRPPQPVRTARLTEAPTGPGTRPTFWQAFRFWTWLGFVNFGGPAGQIALMHDDLVEKRKWISEPPRPLWKRFLVVTLLHVALWGAPILALGLSRGWGDTYTQLALFFSAAAMVTFGGAYAVLSYVAQAAVGTYHWLREGEMAVGLGLAESTPGPLILGAPYVERLRGRPALDAMMTAITAAVVGVILNLAFWLALRMLFGTVTVERIGPLQLNLPAFRSLDVLGFIAAAIAFAGILRWRWNMVAVVGVFPAFGLVRRLVLGA